MPWMLFDRSESHEVQHRCSGRVNAVIQLPAFLIREPRGLDEFGSAVEVLLEEHRRLDPAWIALQNRRPVLKKRHDEIGDAQIVTEQIKLSEFLVGPVNTVQAGN